MYDRSPDLRLDVVAYDGETDQVTLEDIYDLLQECCERLTYYAQQTFTIITQQNRRIGVIEKKCEKLDTE